MKITCQSCQAKYTIADEKVVGKVVKIRCKKCGATIVVNGNDPSATTTTSSSPPALPPQEGGANPTEGWTVNVADGDQRTMTDDEVVAAYQAQVVSDATYCWRESMDDWAPLRDIPALYTACTKGTTAAGPRTASAQNPSNGSGGVAAPPAAARRAGGRAPAADLFGGAAQAGGEEDVMTSAPAKVPQVHDDAQKLTGARNENSVLFSLSTLTGKSDRPPPPPPDSEASGLIDIRQLSAQLATVEEGAKKKGSRVDDIMNLSGGGAFAPTLTAPALSAPALEPYSSPPGAAKLSAAPAGIRNRGVIFAAVGAGLLLVVAAVGGALALMRNKGEESADREKPVPSASAAQVTGEGTNGAVAAASATGTPTEEPSAPSAAASASVAAKDTPAPSSPAAPTKEGRPAGVAAAPPREAPASKPAPAAPAPESDQPFNMGEARARLAAVAGSVQSCKKSNGPTGTGRVVVLFAPSGAAQSATVAGDPFEGTPTGACVASHFRAVRVPAFAGSPFSVSKSFTIN